MNFLFIQVINDFATEKSLLVGDQSATKESCGSVSWQPIDDQQKKPILSVAQHRLRLPTHKIKIPARRRLVAYGRRPTDLWPTGPRKSTTCRVLQGELSCMGEAIPLFKTPRGFTSIFLASHSDTRGGWY